MFQSVMDSVADRMNGFILRIPPIFRPIGPCSASPGQLRPMILLVIDGAATLFLRSLFFLCPFSAKMPYLFIVCKFPKH